MRRACAALLITMLLGPAALRAEPKAARSEEPVYVQHGLASHYGDQFRGRTTASGEPFRQDARTAASRDLPFGASVTVTHAETGRSVEVRVNDRGPHVAGRIIDLSGAAAAAIGLTADGVAPVRIEARPSAQPTEALRRAIARLAHGQAARRPPPPAEKPAFSRREG